MKKSSFLLVPALIAVFAALASAADYNYITGPELKAKLETGAPLKLVDIQVKEEYDSHHIRGALPTYAYPVKSGEDLARLDASIPELAGSDAPVVIVCPRGAGGAERAYGRLKERGIDERRLFILEKGQAGWSYPDYTSKE